MKALLPSITPDFYSPVSIKPLNFRDMQNLHAIFDGISDDDMRVRFYAPDAGSGGVWGSGEVYITRVRLY